MERYINTLFEEAVSNLNAVSEIIKEIEKSIGALSNSICTGISIILLSATIREHQAFR